MLRWRSRLEVALLKLCPGGVLDLRRAQIRIDAGCLGGSIRASDT